MKHLLLLLMKSRPSPIFLIGIFRRALLHEEAEEARRAFLAGDIEALAKELADVLYVTYGRSTYLWDRPRRRILTKYTSQICRRGHPISKWLRHK